MESLAKPTAPVLAAAAAATAADALASVESKRRAAATTLLAPAHPWPAGKKRGRLEAHIRAYASKKKEEERRVNERAQACS